MKRTTIPAEIIEVPEGECVMNILAELGDETLNSWIFIHKDRITDLRNGADKYEHKGTMSHIYWNAKEYPATYLGVIFGRTSIDYVPVFKVDAIDIPFKKPANEPEKIFLIK